MPQAITVMSNPKDRADEDTPASMESPSPKESLQTDNGGNEPQQLRPIEERPPGDDPPPPPPGFPPVRITQISPIAGALAGGIDVTLTGNGFQEGAEVFFGSSQSPEVVVESASTAKARLPPTTETGSVNVSLFNPDGTNATLAGGFTYVVTGTGAAAEVLGVEPLSVIEDTESEVIIRGRNLIEAYTNGMVALRGSTRVHITTSNVTNSRDDATGIEALIITVRITCTPPLEQHERMAIQILASRRPGAQNDGVFESSRQMFTVLPRAMPVPIAFTDNLEPDKPTLVVVAGRNMEGCTLDFGEGVTVHQQSSDDRAVIALVTVSDGLAKSTFAAAQLSLRSDKGGEVAQYEMSVASGAELAKSRSTLEAASAEPSGGAEPGGATAPSEPAETGSGEIGVTLSPVPGQQMLGPTEQDSAVFNLRGDAPTSFSLNIGFDFEFVIFQRTIVLRLINEVRLIPFFDGGSGNEEPGITPVLPEVGKLFRLRGLGLLVVLRVEIYITISVVLIIGFRWNIWPFGLFNEFPEFGWAIGSIVVSIIIVIQIILFISFLIAAVLPGGRLYVIGYFHLELGVEVTISADGRELHFGTRFIHKVNHTRIGPQQNNPRPCDGRFELAEENGESVFADEFGGHSSFYFPRSAGLCCVPWSFDLQLVRFSPGGPEEIVQSSFRTEYCLNAAPSPNPMDVIITSEPPPTGNPPTLEMNLGDSANLRALARPVDETGQPIPGAPRRDLREMGFRVEFFLVSPTSPVLHHDLLTPGHALAVQVGENLIRAAVTSPPIIRDPDTGEILNFAFWPGSVFGFDIVRFLSEGQMPAARVGGLPVQVNPLPVVTKVVVTPTLAYKDAQNQNKLAESPVIFDIPSPSAQGAREVVRELERYEPFETPLEYVVAVKLQFPSSVTFTNPEKVEINITDVLMSVYRDNAPSTSPATPLSGTGFQRGREGVNDKTAFFKGTLLTANQPITLTVDKRPGLNDLFDLGLTIIPNTHENPDTSTGAQPTPLTELVPPGQQVATTFQAGGQQLNRHVLLSVKLGAKSTTGQQVEPVNTLHLGVTNEENFEEYVRVLQEPQRVLSGSAIKDFAAGFYSAVEGHKDNVGEIITEIKKKGADLWEKAWNEAATTRDDRPLYYVRLMCITALRAYFKRRKLSLVQDTINKFEWPSRGLHPDSGGITFDSTSPANAHKAVVTGFDPFAFTDEPDKANPSGVIALALNEKTITTVQPPVFIRSAVFPVRYRDFDAGLIEKAVKDALARIVLLMSCSDNSGRDYYDVERFATRFRAQHTDNEMKKAIAGVIPGGDEYYESTLPYKDVITSVQTLPGPLRPDTPFVIDQSYRVASYPVTVNSGRRGRVDGDPRDTPVKGKFRPEPLAGEQDAYTVQPDQPDANEVVEEASGGDYLSNEIFYRIARERNSGRKTLETGHLHVPSLTTTRDKAKQTTERGRLLDGARQALEKFLGKIPGVRSSGDIAFPPTPINTTSQPRSLTAINDRDEAFKIAKVEVSLPFAFVPPASGMPIPLGPKSSVPLSFTFTPTEVKTYTEEVKVVGESDKLLFTAKLSGEGVVPVPVPVPIIVSFNPSSGRPGAWVTAVGENFTGVTDVRIGGTSVPFTPLDDTRVSANVTDEAFSGPIEVDNPSGTGASSTIFRVVRRFPTKLLSEHLSARRLELGITQRAAAEGMGINAGTYSNWERGRDEPRSRSFPAIIGFLGYDPSPEAVSLAERIREKRQSEGISQRELAERLSIAASTVKSWEADTVRRPTPRVTRIFEEYVKNA